MMMLPSRSLTVLILTVSWGILLPLSCSQPIPIQSAVLPPEPVDPARVIPDRAVERAGLPCDVIQVKTAPSSATYMEAVLDPVVFEGATLAATQVTCLNITAPPGLLTMTFAVTAVSPGTPAFSVQVMSGGSLALSLKSAEVSGGGESTYFFAIAEPRPLDFPSSSSVVVGIDFQFEMSVEAASDADSISVTVLVHLDNMYLPTINNQIGRAHV